MLVEEWRDEWENGEGWFEDNEEVEMSVVQLWFNP